MVPGRDDHDPLVSTAEPHGVLDGIAVVAPARFIERYLPDVYHYSRNLNKRQRRIGVLAFFFWCAIGFGAVAYAIGLLLRLENLSGV
jgi:hypothetical protein